MSESAAFDQEPPEPRAARLMDVAQARRTAIAAARRVIARDGAGRMTLDGVGHEAGLPMGALASHFDNEQELLMAVAAEDLAALAKAIRAGTPSAEESPPAAAPELIERIDLLETAFTSMINRHQRTLHERNDIALWVEQSVKALQQQVDGAERVPTRLRSDVKAAPPPEAPPDPPLPAKVARLLVEPPPMTAVPPPSLRPPPAPVLSATPPAAPVPPAATVAPEPPPSQPQPADLPPVLVPQTGHVTSNSEEAVLMDNYLLDARRAAIATQAGNENQRHEANRRSKRARVLVAAFLGPIVILATAAIVLNRNVVTAEPTSTVAPAPAQVAELVPPEAPAPVATPPEVVAATPADPAPAQGTTAEPLDKLAELAASGDVKAERDLGLKYLAGDGIQANEGEAARWLMRAAYRGEPTAEYWLGTLYARGHGVPADAFQANHWYEAAAQKGNRRAMHSYAVAYFQGWGVEKNYSEAARWFRSAADLGFVDSQFNLAVLYERGAGIPQSLTEAYKWYAIAAQGGDKESESRVAVLATQLAPADLALAQQAAASFRPAPLDQSANLANDGPTTDG